MAISPDGTGVVTVIERKGAIARSLRSQQSETDFFVSGTFGQKATMEDKTGAPSCWLRIRNRPPSPELERNAAIKQTRPATLTARPVDSMTDNDEQETELLFAAMSDGDQKASRSVMASQHQRPVSAIFQRSRSTSTNCVAPGIRNVWKQRRRRTAKDAVAWRWRHR